jgi:hypothetical protein
MFAGYRLETQPGTTTSRDLDISVGDPAHAPAQLGISPPPTVIMPAVMSVLRIADAARFNGKLTYTSRAPIAVGDQVTGGVALNAPPAD